MADDKYWLEYSNLQKVKHQLIKDYLNGWLPKLGFWSGKVVYVDTHAGRGSHMGGQLGSPLTALQTVLNHGSRDKILQKSQIELLFIEHDDENFQKLNEEIKAVGALPNGIRVTPVAGDFESILRKELAEMKARQGKMAPSFFFVDPFGFKISADLLRELMSYDRVELFMNLMWRHLNMALVQGQQDQSSGMADTLDLVFGGREWLTRISATDADERAEQAVDLIREKVGAKWATAIRMQGPNNATVYQLVHFTNHVAGRTLMKECIWKVCPDGGFNARKLDNLSQPFLIEPEPDLSALRSWVIGHVAKGPKRWEELETLLQEEIWLDKHLSEVVRDLRKSGAIIADAFEGRFSRKANPRFTLPPK